MLRSDLKLLILASWYPNRVDPTDGDFIQRFASFMSGHYNLAVLSIVTDPDQVQNIRIEYSEANGFPEILVYKKKQNGLNSFLTFLKAYKEGYKYLGTRWGKPDLVHVQVGWKAGLFALYLRLKYSIQYIVTEHWTGLYPKLNRYKGLTKSLSPMIYHNARHVITVSENLKRTILDHGIKREIQVIPNVCFHLPVKDYPLTEIIQVTHISSMNDAHKNVSGILKVIAEADLTFHLNLIGKGKDSEELKRLSNELGLSEKVTFHDQIKNIQALEIVQQSAFTIMFSNYETFSITTAESLLCGTPVIATVCGGPEEYVKDFCGILIEPGNKEMLKQSFIKMLTEYQHYDRQKISKYAAGIFSQTDILNRYDSFYRDCVKNK